MRRQIEHSQLHSIASLMTRRMIPHHLRGVTARSGQGLLIRARTLSGALARLANGVCKVIYSFQMATCEVVGQNRASSLSFTTIRIEVDVSPRVQGTVVRDQRVQVSIASPICMYIVHTFRAILADVHVTPAILKTRSSWVQTADPVEVSREAARLTTDLGPKAVSNTVQVDLIRVAYKDRNCSSAHLGPPLLSSAPPIPLKVAEFRIASAIEETTMATVWVLDPA